MTYALFINGKQASKEHSTPEAVAVEAFEAGLVWTSLTDFGPLRRDTTLAGGVEIKEIEE